MNTASIDHSDKAIGKSANTSAQEQTNSVNHKVTSVDFFVSQKIGCSIEQKGSYTCLSDIEEFFRTCKSPKTSIKPAYGKNPNRHNGIGNHHTSN